METSEGEQKDGAENYSQGDNEKMARMNENLLDLFLFLNTLMSTQDVFVTQDSESDSKPYLQHT